MHRTEWMFVMGAMGAVGMAACAGKGTNGGTGAVKGAGASSSASSASNGGGNFGGAGGSGGGNFGGAGGAGGAGIGGSTSTTATSSATSATGTTTSATSSTGAGGSTSGGGICSPCSSDSDCAPVTGAGGGASAGGHCNSFGYCDIPWGTECVFGPMCGSGTCDASMAFCDCTAPSGGWPVQTSPTTSASTPWVGTQLLYNAGTNQVSGIYFTDLSHGIVTLQGVDPASFNPAPPGAILTMVGPLQTAAKPLVDGKGGAPAPFSGNDLDFDGIVKCPYGLVVPTDIKAFVGSTDNGKTFSVTDSGVQPVGGPAEASWFFGDSKQGWTAVDGLGYIYTTSTNPLTINTTWTSGSMAVGGGTNSTYDVIAPRQPQLFQSSDGQTMIAPNYNAALFTTPVSAGLSVSTNQGKTWAPFVFGTQPTNDTYPSAPNVIAFGSDTMGIAAFADDVSPPGHTPYVYYTKTGGKTKADWALGKLPSSAIPPQGPGLGDHFTYAFWAADGTPNVWLLGYAPGDGGLTNAPLLYWSADGGATWTDLSPGLATYDQVTDVNGHKEWLVGWWVGFALDAKHVWLGGYQTDSQAGFNVQPLAYTSTGGM
jgi:hypothetical protein